VAQRVAMADLAREPRDSRALRRVRELAGVLNSTALKLRLTIQTEVDRKSGKLDERASGRPRLIGGSGVHKLEAG
jgi:hypothetical protein